MAHGTGSMARRGGTAAATTEDPFDSSAAEVRTLLEQAKAAFRRLRMCALDDSNALGDPRATSSSSQQHRGGRGAGAAPAGMLTDPDAAEAAAAAAKTRARRAAAETADALAAASEELALLRSVVDALKAGKARRATIGFDLLSQREDFVDESEAEVATLQRQLSDAKQSAALFSHFQQDRLVGGGAAGPSSNRVAIDDDAAANDDAAVSYDQHLAAQRSEREAQDRALDRLHFGLTMAQEKAGLMNRELADQDLTLDALEQDVAHVEGRLAANMRRVDSLLQKMSARSRCGLIACLALTAAILLILIVAM